MVSMKLNGKEIPLLYTVCEMKTVQEEVAPLGKLQYVIFGRSEDNEDDASGYGSPEHIGAVAKMIRILGNAGLEEAGQEAFLTDKKVMRSLRPVQLVEAINACTEALREGMASEIPAKANEGPIDVTLEEMNKKKEKDP